MSDPFIGEIIMVGFNFQIRNYALCDGQLVAISQNTALFSLLGTTYGGDGRSTFALPDLRGRMPLHHGQHPGGSQYPIGSRGGHENTTLTTLNLPPHNHTAQVSGPLTVSKTNGDAAPASDTYLGAQAGPRPMYTNDTASGTQGVKGLENASVTVNNAGGGQPVTTISPFLAINFQIAMQGLFPPRN